MSEITDPITQIPDSTDVGNTPEDEDPGTDVLVVLLEDDFFETSENLPVTFSVFSNDANVPPDFIISINYPLNGSISIDNNNTNDIKDDKFTYVPNANFSGSETFQYTLCNPLNPENCGMATVTMIVNPADETIIGELKAFPEAEGFGKYSKGGRGGQVFKVTNLNNSGAGSLRAALETSSSSRTIIFEVSGTITLSSTLRIPSNTTIAGQTAFRNGGQGITIKSNGSYGSGLMSINSSDVIIRYLRFRRGKGINNEQNGDNVTVTSGNNVIFDHCSFSWSTDESFNTWGTITNLTLQNCIFSESLMYSSHEYTTDPNHSKYSSPHSMGLLVGLDSDRISFYRNLFAHNNQRNPLIGGVPPPKTDFELVNNYIYNWGQIPTVIEGNNAGYRINLIGNKWKRGNNSAKRYAITFLESNGNKLFASGNISPERTSLSQNEWLVVGSGSAPYTNNASTSYQSLSPFNYPILENLAISANDLETQMLTKVGASLNRDAVDNRIVNDVINGTGSLIDDPSNVGGWPILSRMNSVSIDIDNDGIPDAYEILKFTGLDRDGKEDFNNDGYTDLEDYLNSLDN